ncbi:MAG: hypothetical protein KA138_04920, partial [Saprospiraceae bacterium]|nr:hypothetical protein [Saprospiraceae bacterium]
MNQGYADKDKSTDRLIIQIYIKAAKLGTICNFIVVFNQISIDERRSRWKRQNKTAPFAQLALHIYQAFVSRHDCFDIAEAKS